MTLPPIMLTLIMTIFSIGLQVTDLHGLNFEDEAIKVLGGEIKFSMDQWGLELIREAAEDVTGTDASAGNVGTWDATIGASQEWVFVKREFEDQIEKGSNQIFAASLRGNASYIIAGNNVARVIKQLAPSFVPAPGLDTTQPTGPMEIGKLLGRPVIQNPFFNTNRYVLGYKGDSYLHASFIFAPYIPLFSTPTVVLGDLNAQKAFMASSGFKIVNPKLLAYGTVSNLQ